MLKYRCNCKELDAYLNMEKATVWGLHLMVFFCCIISVPAAPYQVSVIAPEGPLLLHSIVMFVCTISPTPPCPIEFAWRTSASDHSVTKLLNTSHCTLTMYIPMTHPTVGRYFCHVRSGDITLGVGGTAVQVQGLILPAIHTSASFSLSDPITLQVEVHPDPALTLTFAWYHNNSDLSLLAHRDGSGVIFNESESSMIVIDSTVYHNATGMYEARLKKLAFERLNYPPGLPQVLDTPRYLRCSNIALQALKNYAIFRPVIFYISESGIDSLQEQGTDQMVDSAMVVRKDSSVFISVVVDLSKINCVDFRRISSLHYKWSLNGVGILDQYVQVGLDYGNRTRVTRTKVWRRNIDSHQSSFILLNANHANVTLSFPQARTQDAGIYELQVFMNTNDLPFDSRVCRDYINFLSSSKGLNINSILLGFSAVNVVVYDFTKVSVVADQVNAEMGGTDSLTCTVLDSNEVSFQYNISWVKNGQVIIDTIGHTLAMNTSQLLGTGTSHFGTYSCVVSGPFGTAVETIHIAEEVDMRIQLRLIEPNNCTVWENSSDTLDAILQDVSNTVSLICGCNVTTSNFLRPSLRCSSNNVITLMSTFAYANSEGTVLANSVIESTNEWMKGLRRINQTVYQLSTMCPIIITAESEMAECTLQQDNAMRMTVAALVLVILGCFFGGLLTGLIVIGTIYWSLKCRRKLAKQQKETRSPTPAAHKQTSVSTEPEPVTQSSTQIKLGKPGPYLLRQRSETRMADNLAYGCRSEVEESYSVVYDYPSVITVGHPEEETNSDSTDIYEKIND